MSIGYKQFFLGVGLIVVFITIDFIYSISTSLQNFSPTAFFRVSLDNITDISAKINIKNDAKVSLTNDHLSRYLIERQSNYSSNRSHWFTQNGKLPKNADSDGPILDFLIIGFPKCGTTTVVANLAHIAPVPAADMCAHSMDDIVKMAYEKWPAKFNDTTTEEKFYRGAKCPSMINGRKLFSILPRAKLIVGIRHPVLWFQSFWNMQAGNYVRKYKNSSPYERIEPCSKKKDCKYDSCPAQLFCVHRSRFHVTLAKLGKTPLTSEERKLLAPNDADGGMNLKPMKTNVTNPLFLYEQTQLGEEYVWEGLSRYLNYHNGTIRHDQYIDAHGNEKNKDRFVPLDICKPEYDDLRALMMPYAYEISHWVCDYFITAENVVVADRDKFCDVVRGYKNDPCGRLRRMDNGTYLVDVTNNEGGENRSIW